MDSKEKQNASELTQESRDLLNQAKKYREELSGLPKGDPRRNDLETQIRFLLDKSRELSRIAKNLMAS